MLNPKYFLAIRRFIDFLHVILFFWVLNIVKIGVAIIVCVLAAHFILAPIIIFSKTGVLTIIPIEIDSVYKTIKFILFSATWISIILWVAGFVFPEDTKTKKYWWNKTSVGRINLHNQSDDKGE